MTVLLLFFKRNEIRRRALDHHDGGVVGGGKEKDVSMRVQLIRCRDVLINIELADHRNTQQQGAIN
jgi:hypothetical protein